jgi:adenylate cyclase
VTGSGEGRPGPERPELGRLAVAAAFRVAAANLVGSVTVFVYFQYVSRPPVTSAAQHRHDAQVSIAVFVAYIVAAVILFRVFAQQVYPRDYAWVAEDRAPTPAERETVLHEPLRLGTVSLVAWIGAAAVFIGLNLAFGNGAAILVRLGVGIVFGGLTTSTLAFLLVERTLRPAFAYVLAGGTPRPDPYLGVRPRLMLSWAVGSGVPLLGIALAVGGPSHPADPAGAVAFLVAVGVIGGWLSMFVAARSVADPIEAVRHAVRQVGDGDLDAEVTVDDGGEVGLLQAGFNQMVAGLRERQRLRDLFGRHVGDEVAHQALERGVGLGGEQREASALFIDLVGSTALGVQRPPHEVVATLNAMFDAVVRAVAAEGGWVNKFEGDAALCVFGAPSDQPDHAARALRAARGLRATLDARRDEGVLAGLDAGIGVSSGVVVAGNVGAEQRYEYTVIGDPVNEAARLTELAKQQPGRVLASEQAVRAAAGAAGDWAVVGEFELRGRGRPTCAYAPG